MTIQVAAIGLALFAMIGIGFLGYVLYKQFPLLREPASAVNKRLQYTLFSVALTGFLSQTVLLGIDILTMFHLVKRSTGVLNPIGMTYAFTIAAALMVLSVGLWFMYWLITRENQEKDR